MAWTLYQGDCLTELRKLPDESINCCVTSPPYWGLRDYGVDGQLGLEQTPEEYVAKMIEVFHEVKRVLRKDGTLWLNLGDSYSGGDRGCDAPKQQTNKGTINLPKSIIPEGLKPKNLVGIPWRVAFALQSDGWYLRSDIIWSKPNPMPESVTDRPTKAHEYIFLLSKSAKYFYNADEIKEPAKESSLQRLSQDTENQSGSQRANGGNKKNGPMKAVCFGGNKADGYGQRKYSGKEWSPIIAADALGIHDRKHQNAEGLPYIKVNKRTVWTITTKPFSEAHFATFPPELPEICIKAGCPEGGTVMDPFAGSGTTLWVAEQLGVNSIGIELNPDYCQLIKNRMASIEPSLFEGATI